jgi:hypothetical protein
MGERNQYDTRDCSERGLRAEERFALLAQERGFVLTPATQRQNIHEHWDWLLVRGEERFRVDVKAMKRIARHHADTQDAWLWIELHSVRANNRGWLYDGHADLIAFEQWEGFLLVRRVDLIDLVARLVDLGRAAASPARARYAVYRRAGRPDALTLIEAVRVRAVAWEMWGFHEEPRQHTLWEAGPVVATEKPRRDK